MWCPWRPAYPSTYCMAWTITACLSRIDCSYYWRWAMHFCDQIEALHQGRLYAYAHAASTSITLPTNAALSGVACLLLDIHR